MSAAGVRFRVRPFRLVALAADGQKGFSLIEVMIAMVILSIGLLGAMTTFEWADRGLHEGVTRTRALALAESKLEVKRAVAWNLLLTEDGDADGVPDAIMRDDGVEPDEIAGDRVYTASSDHQGIRLVWTVAMDHPGPLAYVGSVVIRVRADYPSASGQRREVRLGTIRANPRFVGLR
jgi:prepilin-type N-terminal cleavage/methylation domain-containing protein